tara:strand:- start:521 stop:868 length:348 start_codon:yes stop_codon:yes gene_type:complete
MTKKKPVNLAGYYRKNKRPNRGSEDWIMFEQAERIRLASMLAKREELANARIQKRMAKEERQRRHLHRFLVAVGGQELFNLYNRSLRPGATLESLGIAQHPDYEKKFGIVSEEEE